MSCPAAGDVALRALPGATLELGEVPAVTITSRGSFAQFARGADLQVTVDPAPEGGPALSPGTIAHAPGGFVTFSVFTGTVAPATFTVTVTDPDTGLSGSVDLTLEPETTVALDAPSPGATLPGTEASLAITGTASGDRAFLGSPTVGTPAGSGVTVTGVGFAAPPAPAGFTLIVDVAIADDAALGDVPLAVDLNGPEHANAKATAFLTVGAAGGGDPYADEVIELVLGTGPAFGTEDRVLGPPRGAGTATGSLDVLSLGDGGTITLAFTDNVVVDGPGDDLVIFENAFYNGGNPLTRFIELATVEVSDDGVDWLLFPTSEDDAFAINDPNRWSGYAGVSCVDALGAVVPPEDLACGDGSGTLAGIGGDKFDLADVGLAEARFVRITDVNRDPSDPGDIFAGGFDLDAAAALHSAAP